MNGKRILWRGSAPIEYSATRALDEGTLALVNRWAGGAATADNVYVARMVVCNNVVDHYSTQFTERALGQIVPLLMGANVMRNHNEFGSDDLPIGRIFDAGQERVGDVVQDFAWFYWDRGTEDGDAMALKIALRLWRECSLSWWMTRFTNSIDGKPFDESPYYPGQELPGGVTVVGIMDDVVEVNEVSVVARGGQKGTSIGDVRVQAEGVRDVHQIMLAARARAAGGAGSRWLDKYTARRAPVDAPDYFARIGIART